MNTIDDYNNTKHLIIIGNGFDLYHNMKTSYMDYRDFLLNSGNKDIIDYYELALEDRTDYETTCLLWSNMESQIALLPYEQAYGYLKSYGDENWSDSYHHDFEYEIKKMAKYWPGIRDWIDTVEYTNALDSLKNIINDNSKFLSFNYTNTLEKLYSISKNNICYIHGDASVDEKLILGHRNESYYPEWDDNNMDEDIRLLNAGAFMEGFRKETYKPVEEICENNELYKHFISEYRYSDIYIIGLSYNDIDKPYIENISRKQVSKWHLVCYKKDDYANAVTYAESIGLKDYELIGYDAIEA